MEIKCEDDCGVEGDIKINDSIYGWPTSVSSMYMC